MRASWKKYQDEIAAAKKEYDETIMPFLETLQRIREQAWEIYVKRIAHAEVFLKEE